MRERVDRARVVQRERFANRPGSMQRATWRRVTSGALPRLEAPMRCSRQRLHGSVYRPALITAFLRSRAPLRISMRRYRSSRKHVGEAIQYRSLDRRGVA